MYVCVHMWMLWYNETCVAVRGQLGRELIFSIHHVNLGDKIQIVRTGARYLYQRANPLAYEIFFEMLKFWPQRRK